MAFADAAGANEDEIPVITMCRAGMQLRQAIMPTYNVDKIVDSTPFRKDGTEIISKNGKRMWRVILDIREFPGKSIVGFTPFEPDERFLGEQDLIVTAKQWEGRKIYGFSIESLLRSQDLLTLPPAITPKPRVREHGMDHQLASEIFEFVDELQEILAEFRGKMERMSASDITSVPEEA